MREEQGRTKRNGEGVIIERQKSYNVRAVGCPDGILGHNRVRT